eukprot:5832513-Prymnesium_polylepis.1
MARRLELDRSPRSSETRLEGLSTVNPTRVEGRGAEASAVPVGIGRRVPHRTGTPAPHRHRRPRA